MSNADTGSHDNKAASTVNNTKENNKEKADDDDDTHGRAIELPGFEICGYLYKKAGTQDGPVMGGWLGGKRRASQVVIHAGLASEWQRRFVALRMGCLLMYWKEQGEYERGLEPSAVVNISGYEVRANACSCVPTSGFERL